MSKSINLSVLSARVGVSVKDHPFDVGYWSRVGGLARPRIREKREGWDTANAELEHENKEKNDV